MPGPPIDIVHPIFPIFFSGPAISSLSPPGAVVNDAAFILTVNGSGFANGATVNWNGAARATTFVSANLLTASIAAADIAATAAGQLPPAANVTVTNPGGAGSNAVPFSIIPDITGIEAVLNTIQTMTAAQFPAQQPGLVQAVNNLSSWANIQITTINNLKSQVNNLNAQNANLTSQVANLNAQVTQLNATVAQLQSQLAAAKHQTASPLDVAQSFKGVVDQIQQAARQAGGTQTTLTNMNIQLKSLVNVQPGAQPNTTEAVLVFPDPTALPDPNHLSTLTLSFGAIPNLKAAAAPAPTPSGPTPAPAPTPHATAAEAHPAAAPPAPTEAPPTETPAAPEGQKAHESITERLVDKIRSLGTRRTEPMS
ncbi:MAG TPA: hypothetical protein VG204_15645 [Terriglobia bacterium]|nr:hypothetical protein [Terriglobia bacterium]